MKLLIDQGNTRTKLALVENNTLIDFLASEDLQEKQFLVFIANKQITKAVYASVAKMPPFLEEYCNNYAKNIKSLVEKKSDGVNSLRNLYGFYDSLGADLLSAALYAYELGNGDSTLTISMGSCITCVVVDANGEFMGGSISPGITMRAHALHQFTNALPRIEIVKEIQSKPLSSIEYAKDTVAAILKGIISGVEGELLKNVGDFKTNYPTGKVFITGGDAQYFNTISELIHVENMVLMGLNLL